VAKMEGGWGGYREAPATLQQCPQQPLQPPGGHKLLTWVKTRTGSQRRLERRGRDLAVGGNGVRGTC